MPAVILVKNLCKRFRDVTAVDDLSFSVEAGEIYGFLGQNGAGKSTTIRMLLTLIAPTSGSMEIFGKNLLQHRSEILRNVGAIIERPDMYKYLSGLENLRLFARMSGCRAGERQLMDQLEMVGLADRAHSKVRTYSQGMKQRLGIATALVHDPSLIILDEPTNGLDPQGIADIRNLILHLSRERKKTLMISSHLLHEMEMVADSMLIIDKGRKVVEGRVSELFDPSQSILELKASDSGEAYRRIMASELSSHAIERKGEVILFRVHREKAPDILRKLLELGIEVYSFHSRHSLEDYFLSLTSDNRHVEAFTN